MIGPPSVVQGSLVSCASCGFWSTLYSELGHDRGQRGCDRDTALARFLWNLYKIHYGFVRVCEDHEDERASA